MEFEGLGLQISYVAAVQAGDTQPHDFQRKQQRGCCYNA